MKNNLDKVMKMFGIMWLLTGLGMIIGSFLPLVVVIPIALGTIFLVIVAMFVRSFKLLSKGIVYLISLLLGITLYASVNFYIGELGLGIVTLVFGTCVVIFTVLGLFGYNSKRNFGSMGKYLFIALLGLVVFSIISIFVSFSNILMLIASAIGVLIFVGYTIYDFNQIAKNGVAEEDIPITALNLQLDFINLFLQLLKFVYYLKQLLDD